MRYLRRKLTREWFGVWSVQNYFSTLENRASAGARITYGYILMSVVSAVLATGGLLLNNAAVIIGSMCVAPFLGPSRAVCIGGVFFDRKLFFGGLAKQVLGLLIVGAGVAYVVTACLIEAKEAQVTHEILLRSMPTRSAVTLSILIAVAAGAAASLALTADPHVVESPWGQVIDAVIGVEIAISLIPPASVIGIGLALRRPDISYHALGLLTVNVVGLDIVGSMLMLAVRGIRLKYLLLEKTVRRSAETGLTRALGTSSLDGAVNVALLTPSSADVRIVLRRPSSNRGIKPTLAKDTAVEIKESTGCSADVAIEIIPVQTYSMRGGS